MKTASVCALIVLAAAPASPENWPNWRGPDRDGVSREGVPVSWSAEDVVWSLAMPTWGGSTPIVWGDRLFLTTPEGGERHERRRPGSADPPDTDSARLSLWSVDRATGRLLWKRSLGAGNEQRHKQNMASPSPVTDGTHVWALTGTGVVKAFDFDGRELWSRDLQAEYGAFGLMWGYASSPTLHRGALYVQVLHGMKTDDPSYVLALDASTGATRWRVERPTDAIVESPDAYTTPAIARVGGHEELIVAGGDYVTGHDLATGDERWRVGGLNPGRERNYRVVASPLVHGDLLFVPTRVRPLQAFRIAHANGVTTVERLWQTDDGPDVPTPVTDGRYLYVVKDNGVAFCFDAETGAVVWGPERLRARTYSASPVLAGDKIYVTAEDGVTSVFSAGPAFRVLGENVLPGYTLSSPALADGQIFIRTEKGLYCIGGRATD